MIRVSNLKLNPKEDKSKLIQKACKKLRVDTKQVKSWEIFKESLDARDKKNIFFIYTIDINIENEGKVLRSTQNKDVSKTVIREYEFPKGKIKTEDRPVVVGFGPAGLFAALTLCQMGFKPIVLERGKDIEERTKDVEEFWKTGKLNVSSNVQFGEGGAGTFSDGKLTSRSKDPRSKKVIDEFIKAGAPHEIAYVHNPHIGTDKLRYVVKTIRDNIIAMGGEVRFNSLVTDLAIENNQIRGVVINGEEVIPCKDCLLALGHSARDTFEMLYDKGVSISQKSFAVGARIEHLQKDINIAQYGEFFEEKNLGAAEYKLTYTAKDGRGVYTFCMCPGGNVVAAASEEESLAVNGMSYHSRNGKNGNSALLVQINTADFESSHPLAGMYFQRDLEKKAFVMGGGNYSAPCQKVGDFISAQNSEELGKVQNTYKPETNFCDLNLLFPKFVSDAMKEAIVAMARKLKGFDNEQALLTAVESRSSSPVRIDRSGETSESINIKGLYPIGEGAGYAGGIVSAGIDGIMVSEKIFKKYSEK